MISELLDCFACSVLWFVSEWIVSLTFAFYRNHVKRIDADPINMRLFGFGSKQSDEEANGEGEDGVQEIIEIKNQGWRKFVWFSDNYIIIM